MDCSFCGSAVQGEASNHPECWSEYGRRCASELCRRCGKTRVMPNSFWCSAGCESAANNGSQYVGYPGAV